MKLYATTTSERASKGQGGNDFLDIEILGENKGVIGKIRVEVSKEYYSIILGVPYIEDGVISRESARRIQKGKSQKGEVIHESDIIKNDDGDEVEQ